MAPSADLDVDCKYNSHCPKGAYCIKGNCVLAKFSWSCALHRDCNEGQMCYWGECVDATKYQQTKSYHEKCRDDHDCSMRVEKGHTCQKGFCQSVNSDGTVNGCEIEYLSHGDSFFLYGKRFENKEFHVLVLATDPKGKGFFITESKTTIRTWYSRMLVKIPDWADCFQLVNGVEFESLYECEGSHAVIKGFYYADDRIEAGGYWVCRNSPF